MKYIREIIQKYGIPLCLVLIIVLVYRHWFSFTSLATGDWAYKSVYDLQSISHYFNIWDGLFANGMGGSGAFGLGLNSYYLTTASVLYMIFGFPWGVIEKIVWFWPYMLLSVLGPFVFGRRFFRFTTPIALLSSLIYSTNTYALMLVGGGQLGVAMGYALLPFVLYGSFSLLRAPDGSKRELFWSLIQGVLFSALLLFDLRIAYISLTMLGLLYIIHSHKSVKKTLRFLVIPMGVTLLVHAFWLIPLIVFRQNPLHALGSAYTGEGMVKFLSFATYEHALSLLHPNWPENIFGKIGFLRPEFLLLPILSFLGLLLRETSGIFVHKKHYMFFILLGLTGAFLAKGANEPFGSVYLWLFARVPGFVMFRDASKWYSLIAISYSACIPFVLSGMQYTLRANRRHLPVIVFLLVWMFLIREGITGQLNGTFVSKALPSDYQQLASHIAGQKTFYRTLWIPKSVNLSYRSVENPAMNGLSLPGIRNEQDLYGYFHDPATPALLSRLGIKYIIVPDDYFSEIFLTDRKYDDAKFTKTVSLLNSMSWIRYAGNFGKITLFETETHHDLFWIEYGGSEKPVSALKKVSPTKYILSVPPEESAITILFSQGFDPGWIAKYSGGSVRSTETYDNLNSFRISAKTPGEVTVEYEPQKIVDVLIWVSLLSLISVIFGIGHLFKREQLHN